MLKKFFTVLCLILVLTQVGYSQASMYFGDEFYKEFKYKRALPFYLKAVQRKPTLKGIERLADCYRFTNNYGEALKWYERATAYEDCRTLDFYYWAMMLKTVQQYDLAKEKFSSWAARDTSMINRAKMMMSSCDSAKIWLASPQKVFVTPEFALNSTYTDFGTTSFKTGVVFTSNRPVKSLKNDSRYSRSLGKPFYKLFYADSLTNDTAKYLVLPLAKEINKRYNDGPSSFSKGYDTVWFTRTNVEKGRGSRNKVNNLQIYYSIANETGWFISLPFKYNNTAFSFAHPCISKNGKLLFFSSDKPGGFGGMDVYYCILADTGWSNPINLGSRVNSYEDDVFPFYDEASATLYFSSAGHASMGALDIFRTSLVNNTWTAPKNLRAPYNSPKDDFSFALNRDKQSGFLSSNRSTQPGDDDIFRFSNKLPGDLQNYKVGIRPITIENGVEIGIDNAVIVVQSLSSGDELKPQPALFGDAVYQFNSNEVYKIDIIKEGFFRYTLNFTTADLQKSKDVSSNAAGSLSWRPLLRKLVLNECIVLQNIYYDYNSADLRKESYRELDKVATLLVENPSLKLQLGSHTDSRGDEDYNMTLSRRRAQNAVRYIIGLGITSDRIIAKGYGESEPLNKCIDGISCTENEFQTNRRTDFRIIGLVPNKTIIELNR